MTWEWEHGLAMERLIATLRADLAAALAAKERAENALRELYEPASIAVNPTQIIRLGGDDICQPCQNRKALAKAIVTARVVLGLEKGKAK